MGVSRILKRMGCVLYPRVPGYYRQILQYRATQTSCLGSTRRSTVGIVLVFGSHVPFVRRSAGDKPLTWLT